LLVKAPANLKPGALILLAEHQNGTVEIGGATANFASDFASSLDKLDYLPIVTVNAGLRSGILESSLENHSVKKPVKNNNSIDPVKTLVNRTRSKTIDWVVKGRLMNDPVIRATSPLHKNYVRSTICNQTLTQEDGKIKAIYCKERWCCLCNRIRTAILLNKYGPILEEWDDKYFVTLTLVSPTAEELPATLDLMIKVFGLCAMSIKQTKKLEFQALRKIEVTYNDQADTYNSHLHAIVKGKEQAEALRDYWLEKINNRREAKSLEKCQKVTKCDGETLKEMFKYFTKLIHDQKLYPRVLDIIFRAMRGRRTFQGYFPKKVQARIKQQHDEEEMNLDKSTPAITRLDERIHWDYIIEAKNYCDKMTGELLTSYRPTKTFERLLEKLSGVTEKQDTSLDLVSFNNNVSNEKTESVFKHGYDPP
jgi:Replication protein